METVKKEKVLTKVEQAWKECKDVLNETSAKRKELAKLVKEAQKAYEDYLAGEYAKSRKDALERFETKKAELAKERKEAKMLKEQKRAEKKKNKKVVVEEDAETAE